MLVFNNMVKRKLSSLNKKKWTKENLIRMELLAETIISKNYLISVEDTLESFYLIDNLCSDLVEWLSQRIHN